MSDDIVEIAFSACKYGRAENIKLLLESPEGKKMNWNSRDSLGNTPLHYAVSGGHEEIIRMLTSSGVVNMNSQNGRGDTPLHKAILRNTPSSLDVVQLLIENGADPNIQNKQGKLPEDLTDNQRIKSLFHIDFKDESIRKEIEEEKEEEKEESDDDDQ